MTVQQVTYRNGCQNGIVITPADRRIEKHVTRLLEPGQRIKFLHAFLDVGMAGFEIVCSDAQSLQFGSLA